MLGSGIFVLPGVGFTITGPSLFLAFFLAALCILPAAMSKSELSTAMPTSGGTYVYMERTFGPLAGTIAGLGLFLSIILKASFALVGFGAYLEILANIPLELAALTLLAIIVAINLLGVGKVGWLLGIVTAITILTLSVLTVYSFPQVQRINFEPLLTNGVSGLMASTALVFVSFAGVTKIAAIAEEIKNPGRNLPRGILFSLIFATTIYCSVTFIIAGVLPMDMLSGNLRPVYTLAEHIGGKHVGTIIAVIAILTMFSVANAALLAGSRFPFAMSRDNLLPPFLGKIHPKFLTPFWSILLSGFLVALAILNLDMIKIAKLASAFMITMFMFVNFAVIVLRETHVQWYQPAYHSPLYPFTQLFGMIACIALLIAMGSIVPLALLTISVPGLLIYLFFSRTRTDRKGVLGIRGPRKDLIKEDMHKRSIENIEDIDFNKASVIVAMFGNERSPEVLTQMGVALANEKKLEVVHVTEVPEQTELNRLDYESSQVRSIRRRIKHMAQRKKADLDFNAIVSHDIYKTIHDISQRMHSQWLVTEWGGRSRETFTLIDPMRWLKNHLSCNLMTFRDKGVHYFKNILVIVETDQSNELLLQTADHLASVNKAEITLATYIAPGSKKEVSSWKKQLLIKMSEICSHSVDTLIISGDKKWEAFCQVSDEFDMLILESQNTTSFYQRLFGSTDDKIMEHSTCSVISVLASTKDPSQKNLRKFIESAQEALLASQR